MSLSNMLIGMFVAYGIIINSHSRYYSRELNPMEIFLPIVSCILGLLVARIVYEATVLFFKHYEISRKINRNLERLLKKSQ